MITTLTPLASTDSEEEKITSNVSSTIPFDHVKISVTTEQPSEIFRETTSSEFEDITKIVTLALSKSEQPSTTSEVSGTTLAEYLEEERVDKIQTSTPKSFDLTLAGEEVVSESTLKFKISTSTVSETPITLSTMVEGGKKEALTKRLNVSEESKTTPLSGLTDFTEFMTLKELTTEAEIVEFTELEHDLTATTMKVNDSTTTDRRVKAETTEAEGISKSTTLLVHTTPKVTLNAEDVFKDNETRILDYSTAETPSTEEIALKSVINKTEETITTPCAPVTVLISETPKKYPVSLTTESLEELSTTKGLLEDEVDKIATTKPKVTLKEEMQTQPLTAESSTISYTTLAHLVTDKKKATTISDLEEVTMLDKEIAVTSTSEPHVISSEVTSTEPSTEDSFITKISKTPSPTTKEKSSKIAAKDEEVITQPTPITSEFTFSEVTERDMLTTSIPKTELEGMTETILYQTTSSKEAKFKNKTLIREFLSTTESTKPVAYEEAVTETPSSEEKEMEPSTTGYSTKEEAEEAEKFTPATSTEKSLLTTEANQTWRVSTTHKMSTFETFTTQTPLTDKSITITEDIAHLPKSTTPKIIEEDKPELTTIPSKIFKTIDAVTKKVFNFTEEILIHIMTTTEPVPAAKMDEYEIDEKKLVTEPALTTSTEFMKVQDIGLSTEESTEEPKVDTSTLLPYTETVSEFFKKISTLPSEIVNQTEATTSKSDLSTHPSKEDLGVSLTIKDQTEKFEITLPKSTPIPTIAHFDESITLAPITTLKSDLSTLNDTSKMTTLHFETTSYPTSPKAVEITEKPFTKSDLSVPHETTLLTTEHTKISTSTPPITETVLTINETAQTVPDFILKDHSTTSQPYINITFKDEITEPSILTSPKINLVTSTEAYEDGITTEEVNYKEASTIKAISLTEKITEPPIETSTYLDSKVTEPFKEAVTKMLEVLNLTTLSPMFTKVYKIDAFGLKENRTLDEGEEKAESVTAEPKADDITKTTTFTTLVDDSLSFVTNRSPSAEVSVTPQKEETTTLISEIVDAIFSTIMPSSEKSLTDFQAVEVTTLESSAFEDTKRETIPTTSTPSSLSPTTMKISDITNETIDFKKDKITPEGDQDTNLIDKVWMAVKSIIKNEDNQTITTILPKRDEDKFVESTTTPLYPTNETKSTASLKTQQPVETSTPYIEDDFFGEIDHHEITEEDYETTPSPVEIKNRTAAKPFDYGVKTHDFEDQRKEIIRGKL